MNNISLHVEIRYLGSKGLSPKEATSSPCCRKGRPRRPPIHHAVGRDSQGDHFFTMLLEGTPSPGVAAMSSREKSVCQIRLIVNLWSDLT